MKFSWSGALRMKPFDETADAALAGKTYAMSATLSVLVVVAAMLSLAALVLVLFEHPAALSTLGAAVAVTAVTSGVEWSAGLKARALNQLFAAVVVVAVVSVLNRI